MTDITTTLSVVSAAFLGSAVEIVEAFTIVLAVAVVRGWKPALLGTAAGLIVLAVLVGVLGPVLDMIPLRGLQIVIGILLLLFGLRWLRKAILRLIGTLSLRDEAAAFTRQTQQFGAAQVEDWIAGIAAFKAVVLEGIEVVFIVIAVGAGHGLLGLASLGAAAACLLVLAIGVAIRAPLSRVPENTLKLVVGVMLSAFGLFWLGEGLGVPWPGSDLIILVFIAGFAVLAAGLRAWLRPAQSA